MNNLHKKTLNDLNLFSLYVAGLLLFTQICSIGYANLALSVKDSSGTASGLLFEGELEVFLKKPQMEMQQVFKGNRFPNVVVAADGTVLAFWNGVKVRRSEDGGKTWGREILVGKGFMGGGVTVDEKTGDILAFVEKNHPPAPIDIYRSSDCGKTWKKQDVVIHPDKNGNVPSMHMNEHGITLRHGKYAGRLMRPSRWYAAGNRPASIFPDHYTNAIYSDDGGKTWLTSDPFPANGTGEATIVELSDGTIYYNSRRHWAPEGENPRRRWTARSTDGGHTWKELSMCKVLPDGDQIKDYGLMAGLVRLPVKGRDVLIFSNIESPSGRHHGYVWASFDGGRTWPIKRQVYEGPFAYSSLDAGRPGSLSEGLIYLLFEGGPKGGGTLAKFNLSWLLCGQKTGDGQLPQWLDYVPPKTVEVPTAVQEQPNIPVMTNRADVPVLWVNVKGGRQLQQVTLDLSGTTNVSDVRSVKVFSAGSKRPSNLPDKAVLFGSTDTPKQETLAIKGQATINPQQDNWFLVTVTMNPKADLLHHLGLSCTELTISNQTVKPDGQTQSFLRLGCRVRHKGDDGSKGYRIPGLATSNAGTLLAIYDIRREGNRDLQGDMDIGLSRSTDGGQTWLPMQVVLDMGTYRGLPQKYNGVSDAGILVDKQTGRIFVFGCWMFGLRNKDGSFRTGLTENSKDWAHQWHGGKVGSGPGMTPKETAQFLMAYSDDDGKTWSKPVNLTPQVKRSEWYLFCTAPGNGITMSDGTLVLPCQGRDENGKVFSNIIYSKDHGKTWQASESFNSGTNECAVVELSDGTLMLNGRDAHSRSSTRGVVVSNNLGKTWKKHATDHKTLIEPTCMASLIQTEVEGKSVLFFSNPNNRKQRRNLTIKASLDDGITWPKEYQVELDSVRGAYSCLTRVDDKTIGILYESSQGYLIFQKIPVGIVLKSL